MKAILIIGILAIVGYAVWKFIEAKRIKNAKKPTIHKVSVKPSKAVKDANDELKKEMERLKKGMDEAKHNPNSLIKYEDESKLKN